MLLLMSVQGQNENWRFSGLCQLPPAADIRPALRLCYRRAITHDIVLAMSRSRIRIHTKAMPAAAKPRQWRAMLILKHGRLLGDVEAIDRKTAEAAAVQMFNLSLEHRKRLVVQERQ